MDRTIWTVTLCYLLGLVWGNGFLYFPISFSFAGLAGSIFLFRWLRTAEVNGPLIVAGIVFILFGIWQNQPGFESKKPSGLAPFIDSGYMWIDGTVVRAVQRGPEKSIAFIQVDRVETPSQTVKTDATVRLTIWKLEEDIGYRDRIRARVKLREALGLRNHWGFDYRAFLARDGIDALASVRKKENIEWTRGMEPTLLGPVYRVRESIRQTLNRSLSPEASAVLQAMLIGETRALTHEIREPFMISGTVHLLSISGSHLAMVGWLAFQGSRTLLKRLPAGWILILSRKTGLVRISVLFTVFPVVGYTLLSGSQVETVRAMVMVLVYLLACWFQRNHHPYNALALSALLILFVNPEALFSVSFQLSYITVLMLIALHRHMGEEEEGGGKKEASVGAENPSPEKLRVRWVRALRGKIFEMVTLSAAAGIVTFPLTAYYFNQVSWAGFISNLAAVPLVGFFMVPLGLICSLMSILFNSETLWFSEINENLTRLLIFVVLFFSDLPYADVHVPAPPMMVVLALYGLAALLVPIRGWGSWKCFLAAGLSGLVLVWAYRIASEPASGNLQVVFFDVGQGDGAWLRFPDGRTMIIDGGRSFKNFDIGRMVIAPFLWNQGQYHVDTVVATHPQLDHVGGLEYLLKKFRVGEVWTNGRDKEAVFYRRFLSVIEEKEIPRLSVGAANFAGFSGTDYEVRVLNPVHSGAGGEVKKKGENDQSIVLRIQYGDEAILFTGDIEGSAERDLLEREVGLKSTVLKVPHHGSRSSIEPEFIKAVRPEVAVISAGRNNPYRHPSSDTLEAYRKVRSDILRTDRQGAVVYVSDGEKRSIRTSADFKVVRVGWDGGIFKTEWKNIRKVLSGYWYGPLGKPMAGKSG